MRYLAVLCFVTLLILTTGAEKGLAGETTCQLEFKVIAENHIGSIVAGNILQGTVKFTVNSSWQQDEETVSYATDGTMTISAQGRGSVSGHVGVVHVVRSPYSADYIAVDADGVVGDLGGQKQYVDPMLIRLYGPRETLTSYDLPKDTKEWNLLSARRMFQVYTPTTADTFNGPMEQLTGSCS